MYDKIAFTFWEGKQFTILHYLTLFSFSKYNSDYKIIVYYSDKTENFVHMTKNNSKENKIHFSGYNYNEKSCIPFNKITDINNVEIINIDVEKEYNINFTTSPIHKSDILRICKLYEHGGIWFDLDILFIRKIPKHIDELINKKDILMFTYLNTIPNGLLISTPKNKAIKLMYDKCLEKIKKLDINNIDEQQFGPTLWRTCFIANRNSFSNCIFLNNKEIYPYNCDDHQLFFHSNIDYCDNNTWGIHWYNGSHISRKFIDSFVLDKNKISESKNISIFYKYLDFIMN